MRIFCPTTYFRPYRSGPIRYLELVGGELVRRGHDVTVLTSRFDSSLPGEERWNGLRIHRVAIAGRLSKGVLMPSLPFAAWSEMSRHDVAWIQLPQLEGGLLALLAWLRGLPVVATSYCDVHLESRWLDRLAAAAVRRSAWSAARRASRVVALTEDYADQSPFLRRFRDRLLILPPAVQMPSPSPAAVSEFRLRHRLDGRRVIGICGRLSREKGFDVLAAALPKILEEVPDAIVAHAGPTTEVAGESAYSRRVHSTAGRLRDAWRTLGVLPDEQMPSFYGACHVTVLPSVNPTESFGLVQVESMLCGTPVVASDLPGVRVPVETTGMGVLAPPNDPGALASALVRVLLAPEEYLGYNRGQLAQFAPERIAVAYEEVMEQLCH